MTGPLRRALRITWFPFFYGARVVASSFQVARDVLTPGSAASPAFIEVPLQARTELEITAIANMVTLTPGTVTVAVRTEPPTLWVHGLYTADEHAFFADIHRMEDYLLGITRRGGAPARTADGEVSP
ncbi:Na+/H+ antiporter subunit E [Nocardiopsis flavescens]|uniref:Multicomponent Na+:H+ antiporter subunit E n=1 Tax=Nocardiopsis flavescens TaxID=758803 RepID=A0A1M6CEH0_9ACTN|nr:Na+/H+ antiporter subunit E [Nocardiopsis flavescens]SHI59425.1 multicomponent Na+:H+ antiporter subunit E [Nocardiopsis flavescens]